ncbi:MAG TPA: ATPase, partial [Acidimicrobiaceae bacterium]|nr:ATPase [Acidimicrobiaceae bacterium]
MVSEADRRQLVEFFDNPADRALLGLVYGRRRIGKSTLLVEQATARGGFYFEATRVEAPAQLRRLGAAVGEYQGTGRLAFDSWEEAVDALLQLGEDDPVPVVLDEFGLILQADPAVDSVLAAALGPAARARRSSAARVVLCGSAIAMMRALTAGEAPLRGRSSLELVMQPDDFRVAATRLPGPDLDLAVRVFSVIGGVVGYATDMVAFDLPGDLDDFDRW